MPDMRHDILVNRLKMLDENTEHQLNHLAVEGLIDKGQADVKINRAVFAQIVFKNLVLRVKLVEICFEVTAFIFGNSRDDLGANDRENARVNQDGHRQDLPLGLNARAENNGGVVVLHRFRTEHINIILNEKLLEFQCLLIALDTFRFLWHIVSSLLFCHI